MSDDAKTPALPKLIEVDRQPGNYSLQIDGEEFPWLITAEGIHVDVNRDGIPSVTLTLFSEEVRVLDTMNRRTPTPWQIEKLEEARRA